MIYRLSKKTGKTYNSDGVEIPMDDNTILFQQYRNDINNGGELIIVDEIEGEQEIIEVPYIVTNAQFRLALIDAGISISDILMFINAIQDLQKKERLLTLFEYANTFERNNPLLISMANDLNISMPQLDQLFINANNL